MHHTSRLSRVYTSSHKTPTTRVSSRTISTKNNKKSLNKSIKKHNNKKNALLHNHPFLYKSMSTIQQRPDVRTELSHAISDELLISLSMNFNNSGNTHNELCDNLHKNNLISTPLIEYAFRKCDRKFFDPSLHPYEDKPHDIGGGATITSAHMHAIALEALGDAIIPVNTKQLGHTIQTKSFLDVGSGSGFITSVFAHIIHALRLNPDTSENSQFSRVTGVEIHPGLREQSLLNIQKCIPMYNEPKVDIISVDAFNSIIPNGPFDVIHCGVSVDYTPLRLLSQLKPGGRAIIPIKLQSHAQEQDLILFTRKNIIDQNIVNNTDDIINIADDIEKSNDSKRINEFISTYFTSKNIMRCVFSTAYTENTVPINMPAIDPHMQHNKNAVLQSFFNKNGSNTLTPEEQKKAKEIIIAQQIAENTAQRLELVNELQIKTTALDTTSNEIKSWHEEYQHNNNGKKPSLYDMQNDAKMNRLLAIVKELRLQIAKTERLIKAIDTGETIDNDDGKNVKH